MQLVGYDAQGTEEVVDAIYSHRGRDVRVAATPGDLPAQESAAWIAIGLDKDQVADIRARLVALGVTTKTPAQIYTQMQTAIDGWGSLAAAKADLREWLPLMAASIVWLLFKESD